MIVREKTPDHILVSLNTIKTAVLADSDKIDFENSRNIFIAVICGLASCIFAIISSWQNWETWAKVFSALITLVFLFFTLWYLFKMIHAQKKTKNNPQNDLESYIVDEAKKQIRYTALLIICFQKAKTGEVTFMTEKNGNYLAHCDLDPYKEIDEQKDFIINYLTNTYSIKKDHFIDIYPLSGEPFFSIKPIHDKPTQNGFIFFQIKLKKKAKSPLCSHKNISWKSLQEMEGMPELMGRNQDIVMALHEYKTRIEDSFDDLRGPLHIIWNITKTCPYNCAICATHDDSRQELTTDQKITVFNHILTSKEIISNLDIAGGDPMCNSETRSAILLAANSLGDEHLSITTTGKGIQELNGSTEEEIFKLLKRCEITIDASHENLSSVNPPKSRFPRSSLEYCNNNYEQIINASEHLQCLTINIPILDDDLSDDELDTLILKLKKLRQQCSDIQFEAQIIRLMPVGAFTHHKEFINAYKTYNPINVAKAIKSRIEALGVNCRYHCSLRVLPEIGDYEIRCNMLERKIGIDCSGNVFACTWGAYLPVPNNDITQNPFYLGNLIESPLKDILAGQGQRTDAYMRLYREYRNKVKKPYCEAVSWFFNQTVGGNHDPLS